MHYISEGWSAEYLPPDTYGMDSQIDSPFLQYISGRFSTGYRATIGADFITKTLPDPIGREGDPGVALQIWVRSALLMNLLHLWM